MGTISNTPAIMSAGIRCLREKLGAIDTEIFIANIKQEQFDYTKWRQTQPWYNMPLEEFCNASAEADTINKSFGLDDK